MSDEMIIKSWKMGLSVKQISIKYMNKYNKKLKAGEKKLTALQVQRYVEPIIFRYQKSE